MPSTACRPRSPGTNHHQCSQLLSPSLYLSPAVPAPARARALTSKAPHTHCVCVSVYAHVCVELRKMRRKSLSVWFSQRVFFFLVQHHLIKLCQRHGNSKGGREKIDTGRRRSLFFHLPPSCYSFHLNSLNKAPSEMAHRAFLLIPCFHACSSQYS